MSGAALTEAQMQQVRRLIAVRPPLSLRIIGIMSGLAADDLRRLAGVLEARDASYNASHSPRKMSNEAL